MGLEILEDAPDTAAVIAAIGGGGLIAGVGSAIKALQAGHQSLWASNRKPPRRCALARRRLAAEIPEWQASFVDGAGGQSVFPRMWERMKPLVDDSLVVSLEETRRAMRLMAEKARVIAEGAGALGARAPSLSGRSRARARSSASSRAAIST